LTTERDAEFAVEEVRVEADAAAVGKTIEELAIGRSGGAIAAIRTADAKTITSHSGATRIHAGDIAIILGAPQQLEMICSALRGSGFRRNEMGSQS
ncbi:MAG: cation:proton antiporter regulatory subunit, partial [Phycisphaerae bacterium]